MKLAPTLRTLTLALGTLIGCRGDGGVEGVYRLDKPAMKESMQAQIAKLSGEEESAARLALAMVERMDISMHLQPGGKLSLTITNAEGKRGDLHGRWRAEGETVSLSREGDPLTCQKQGQSLLCESLHENRPPMILVKSP